MEEKTVGGNRNYKLEPTINEGVEGPYLCGNIALNTHKDFENVQEP